MKQEVLTPRMQNTEEADLGAKNRTRRRRERKTGPTTHALPQVITRTMHLTFPLISIHLSFYTVRGGHPNDPRNLWPEFPHSPNPKDKVEDELHKKVCAGQITLLEAQQIISRDWTKAK
jgi:hypothetical protein